ncbi:hypothetical protein RO3G_13616 [Rhizopus delemar RA 99-880]|uniref:Uncharacterized protein n=1 Tax=Rhizopus delemar (strain RA 99-880 / ATCC MYA-4621 / FGSC 9543 / NRRL 43880) TaxID=246409 RepID=I1CKC5_RHIO9|nr:hypothetical protein RO3G_13616 [Rhizopus delemar RA 99-880]|eukprot:EIE88905.1 hypothetical protein RO3G_13616 [Rhizopus delemar RA 99-880]
MSSIPPGTFFIVSKLNGRVLNVKGSSIENAAPIVVWSKKPSDNQNHEKVLDVKGNKIEKNGRMAARE